MAGIEIRGLTKAFRDGTPAVTGVDLDVADGELLVLIGPSGSGKTTLLRLIAGLDRPTDGTIRIAGKDLAGVPPHGRNVALVFQNLALYSHLTVAENLAFGLSQKGREERGAESGVGEVAGLLGIDHLLERYPVELSGGEQQRVALGRAIVRRPAALLLDEPLSSLDGPTRRELRRELKALQRRLGIPTIYVTHDQAEAMTLGDRIVVLKDGSLQQIGTPDDVYHCPANRFVAEFFGPQGINLIEGELKHEAGQTEFVALGFRLALPPELASRLPKDSTKLLCGVRPEDVAIASPADGARSCLAGTVKSCESLGDATYMGVGVEWFADITVKLGGQSTRPQVFDVILIQFDVQTMHWFDANNGNRLC